jgi:alkanesulfonate monooxygenase SsuD/methylene tetrahydromethanopterin reductase-like flavin-dependent oxidoreductase (luciferase family)
MPVPLRNIGLTAMEIATLDRIFPGRFIAGIGHGVQSWMGQAGVRVDSPMTLLREYTESLRQLLAGERVTVSGRYVSLDDVGLDWPPLTPPRLLLGGGGPKSVRMAAELGDGVMLSNALTDDEVRDICDRVATARQDVGASPGADIVACQIVVTGPGASERLDREVVIWGKEPGRGVGVAGGAEEIAASVRRLAGFGVTSVAIQPAVDEPDLEAFIDFLGGEVRPLLIS